MNTSEKDGPPSSSTTTIMTASPINFLSGVEDTLGSEMLNKIRTSKILLVGAGGIGCELIKNLCLTGFQHVEVIDLDTIDISNLNRQLLFRRKHVGMPKCEVACDVARDMVIVNDDVTGPSQIKYIAHYGNVCDNTKFNIQFVTQFDLVLNALDNVTARRRVNRLCLAAKVPLIEAGTTGYLGQVNVIDRDSNVACYECKTQEAQKVYPICTIRSTPSMPVHTIVWAKELYRLLFGEKVEESMLYEDVNGAEPSTYMQSIMNFRTLFEKTNETMEMKDKKGTILDTARAILIALYIDEIKKQLDMDRYKTAQKQPVVLASEIITQGTQSDFIPPTHRDSYNQNDIWLSVDCVAEFASCLSEAEHSKVLSAFDKDDTFSMRFVTAVSNLRNYVFGIEPIQSYYSAKGIAGNIIPAIATTNAIAAGIQMLQVFQILRSQLEHQQKSGHLAEYCSYVNCLRNPTRNGLYLTSAQLEPANSKCFVCKNAIVPLTLHVKKWTFQEFLSKIVKNGLGFEEPTIMLEGQLIWEEGQDADSDSFKGNLAKPLPYLPCGGVHNGTIVMIEDFSQELSVEVAITNQETGLNDNSEDYDEHWFDIGGSRPQAAISSQPASSELASAAVGGNNNNNDEAEDDDDDVEIVIEPKARLKRPMDESHSDHHGTKRAKIDSNAENRNIEVIDIE